MTELTLELLRDELEPIHSELAFIRARLVVMGGAIDVLQRDVRMTRAAVNDLAKTNITSGEVDALHEDLQRVMAKQDDLEARLLMLERAASWRSMGSCR
jgi:hypothetical protein